MYLKTLKMGYSFPTKPVFYLSLIHNSWFFRLRAKLWILQPCDFFDCTYKNNRKKYCCMSGSFYQSATMLTISHRNTATKAAVFWISTSCRQLYSFLKIFIMLAKVKLMLKVGEWRIFWLLVSCLYCIIGNLDLTVDKNQLKFRYLIFVSISSAIVPSWWNPSTTLYLDALFCSSVSTFFSENPWGLIYTSTNNG